MGCCGNKRQSLSFFPALNRVELQPESQVNMDLNGSIKKAEKLFRFTGETSLEVKSLLGSHKYLFTRANPLVWVLPGDAAMMMAFSELKEVK
jgi:hypothetical protein